MTLPYKTFEEWKQYGLEHGFNERNPTILERSKNKEEKQWHSKGRNERWLKDFSFNRIVNVSPYDTYKEWEKYGLKYGFDKRNPNSLFKSKNKEERSWYSKGVREKWIKDFSFNRKYLKSDSSFESFEEWRRHGLEMGYDKRNPSSFQRSEIKEERSWYRKGSKNKWIKDFEFNRSLYQFRWKNFEEWRRHGLEMGYDKRNPSSFQGSENKEERRWYCKGNENKWLKDFGFERKHIESGLSFESFEEWRRHGSEMGYDKRNPVSLFKSKNKEERSWYRKGSKNKWIKDFEFNRISKWKNFEEWRRHGLEMGYDKRNPGSFQRSENKEERSWYGKGQGKGWIKDFEFKRLIKRFISTNSQFLNFLKENQTARNLAAIVIGSNDQGIDIEDIILDIYNDKFKDQSQLHKFLQENTDEIDDLIRDGITNLGAYLGNYTKKDRRIMQILIDEAIPQIPIEKVTPTLEEKVIRFLKSIYSPEFNKNPEKTTIEISNKTKKSKDKMKEIYDKLYNHYNEVLSIIEELNN